ncbi:MAG: twin-arginine translocase TatA/TatE family subunit [Chloroflexi bacterium]|nr:twin-arginine translocase TatA/TatE family subunit [Chloroflexota bacterium]
MEFLGVGPTELLFIFVIAIIVLGPKDMAKAGGQIGAWLNKFVHSEMWKNVRKVSDDLSALPTRLMREDNLKKFLEGEEAKAQTTDQPKRDAWTGRVPVSADPSAGRADLNRIHAPAPAEESPVPMPRPAKQKSAAPRPKAATVKKKSVVPATQRIPRKKSDA